MKNDPLAHNRLILCHFDTYSSALLFARYDTSVLAPSPLPEGTHVTSAPPESGEIHDPSVALHALASLYELDAAQLSLVDGFEQWMNFAEQPIRIHLARFTTFEAPREAIESHGGAFKPISGMRGTDMLELNLLRRAFNLIMGGA